MKYEYAVMDENQADDMAVAPYSVHHSRDAAVAMQDRLNRNPNNHYRAVQWSGDKRDCEFYNDCLSA